MSYSFLVFLKNVAVFNLLNCLRQICLLYLWPVYRENADKLVPGMRVASVQECGADVLGSVCHLCKKTARQRMHASVALDRISLKS